MTGYLDWGSSGCRLLPARMEMIYKKDINRLRIVIILKTASCEIFFKLRNGVQLDVIFSYLKVNTIHKTIYMPALLW